LKSHKPGSSRRELKKDPSFRGGGSYIMIPLLGLVLAGLVLFFAKDFFLGTKPPEYHKPVQMEEKATPSEIREMEETAANEDDSHGQEDQAQTLEDPKIDLEKAGTAVTVTRDNTSEVQEELSETDEKSVDEKTTPPTSVTAGQSPEAGNSEKNEPLAEPAKEVVQSSKTTAKYQADGTWGIQIGMFSRKSDADRLLKEVSEKGYNPEITRPGTYYRVRVNAGPSMETSLALKKMLHDEGYDTLVVRSEKVPVETEPVRAFSRFQEDNTWGVQVGMFGDRSDATKLAEEVRGKGYNPDITRPGSYYRVRIRAGKDEATASRIEALLSKEGYETLLVRSSP